MAITEEIVEPPSARMNASLVAVPNKDNELIISQCLLSFGDNLRYYIYLVSSIAHWAVQGY